MQATKVAAPLGVAHFSAIESPPAVFIAMAAKAGFSTVGLRLYPPFAGAAFYKLPAGGASSREVLNILDGEGMRIFDVECVVISKDFNAAELDSVLSDASGLGARRLSVCGDDGDTRRLADNFAALADLALTYDMSVDMENMGWRTIGRFADSLTLVEKSGKTNAGVLLDAIHFFRNGGDVSELQSIPSLLLRHIQLCDVKGVAPKAPQDMVQEARTGRYAPGEGVLPLADLIRNSPPGVVFSVEVPMNGMRPADEHLRHLAQCARPLVERCASAV